MRGLRGTAAGGGPPCWRRVPRTNDTWGMGWQNLYDLEVAEMLAADLTQACPPGQSHCWKYWVHTNSFASPLILAEAAGMCFNAGPACEQPKVRPYAILN